MSEVSDMVVKQLTECADRIKEERTTTELQLAERLRVHGVECFALGLIEISGALFDAASTIRSLVAKREALQNAVKKYNGEIRELKKTKE